ncbi:MAG: T9SS type A sorting domain-containing protein [bacterium]
MRIKLSFIMVALILTLWGQIKGQELHIINHYDIEQYTYDDENGIVNYGYIDKYNMLVYSNDYNLNIKSLESNKTMFRIKKQTDFRVGKNIYITFFNHKINIYDPTNNTIIDTCEVPMDLTVYHWDISNNSNYLVGLALKKGIDRSEWHKACEILIWNSENGLLLKRMPYSMNLTEPLTSDQRCFPSQIKISENLNYCTIEWTKINNWGKPFQSDYHGMDLIDLQTETIINRINNVYNSQFFPSKDSLVAKSDYSGGSGITYYQLNLISCKDGNISNKYEIDKVPDFYNPPIDFILFDNFIISAKYTNFSKNLYITNVKTNITKTLTSPYNIAKIQLYNNILVAKDYTDETPYITIYDLSQMTNIEDSNPERILYPNPTKDNVNLKLKNTLNCDAQIIDELGNIIDNFVINGENGLQYNAGKLNRGIYIIQINSSTDSKSYKFIKE